MARGGKRVKWQYGAVFVLPLTDGSFSIGQAIDSMMTHIVYCAFFSTRYQNLPDSLPVLDRNDVISLVAVWKRSLNIGHWPIIGVAPLVVPKQDFPNEQFRDNGYIGAKHYDEGIAEDLVSAYHGLIPWNVMFKEDYYDSMLLNGIERPQSAVVLSGEDRRKYRETRA